MLIRRKFIKGSLLPILCQFMPALAEEKRPGKYFPLSSDSPSKKIEDQCLDILSGAFKESLYGSPDERTMLDRIMAALGEIGHPSSIPLLMEELNNPSRKSQKEIIAYYLAKMGEPQGVEYLFKSLNSVECVFRRDAANFLCDLRGMAVPMAPQEEVPSNLEEIRKKIHALRDSDDPLDRSEVVRLMGRSGDRSYIPYLQSLLRDDFVSQNAPVALYQLNDPTIVPFLMQSLDEENDYDPQSAFGALCEIGDDNFVPALENALKVYEEARSDNIMFLYKSSYDIQTRRYMLQNYLHDDDLGVQLEAAIGYYYKSDPSFYNCDDTLKKRMFIHFKMVPCAEKKGICKVHECALFKNRPAMDLGKWGILLNRLAQGEIHSLGILEKN